MQVDIGKIIIGERLRAHLDPDKLQRLADDMEQNGQLQEIVIAPTWSDGPHGTMVVESAVLIAGYRRLEAAKLLGWQSIRCTRKLGDNIDDASDVDLLRVEYSENELRENFTDMERIAYGVKLKERIATAAHDLKWAGKKPDFGYDPVTGYKVWNDNDNADNDVEISQSDLSVNLRQGYDGGKTDDFVASKIDMSPSKFRQGEYVLEYATEEQKSAIDSGESSIHGVYKKLRPKPSAKATEAQGWILPSTPNYEALEDTIEFKALSPEDKIADLQRQLREANCRADSAESELARLQRQFSELSAEFTTANARIAELEGNTQ
jgi:ParB family chromosome partitioning protein